MRDTSASLAGLAAVLFGSVFRSCASLTLLGLMIFIVMAIIAAIGIFFPYVASSLGMPDRTVYEFIMRLVGR
jgi:hypothetical protein